MYRITTYLTTSAAILALTSIPALAERVTWAFWRRRPLSGGGTQENIRAVPEIDASAGLLALAAVLVIMVFVWERNRRAA